jgi:selenocysteine-specific elongation factor
MSDGEIETEVRSLATDGRVIEAAGLWFERDTWRDLAEGVESILTRFHEHEPLLGGMSREELRSRLCREMPQEAWRAWLQSGVENERLRLEGDRVALAGHRVVLSKEDQALAERIDRRFREAGLDPPDVADVLSEEGAGPKGDRVAELLVSRGTLVRIQDGRLFHGEALESLRARLREHAKTSKTIDVGTFKQLAGVTRKNAIPLLEHLDAERTTRRVGNVREILKA